MDSSVAIAAAYLQLNGFFVLTELPVQVAERQGYRTATDLDLLAIRLPHAAEIVPSSTSRAHDLLLGQDPALEIDPGCTEVLLAEVKRGRARVNAAYHDPDVLRFALRRTGCCPVAMIDAHATTLARAGAVATTTADGHPCRIRIASFAGELGPVGRGIVVLGLAHCVTFIRDRLERYAPQLRGAYFRDPVLNLLGLVDALLPVSRREKESMHAT